MENNILNKLSVIILNTDTTPNAEKELRKTLLTTDKVYSYLIYAQYTNGKLSGWQIEFLVSQTIHFNTIIVEDVIVEINNILIDVWQQVKQEYVIGYKQPPIELLIQIFEPLVKKLAAQQKEHWRHLEYDDLCQICRMVICKLYNKGYYIHGKLITRVYINEIFEHIRPERYKPFMVSLDASANISDDGEETLYADIIADVIQDEEIEDIKTKEIMLKIINQKRELVIEALGGSERQYNQLVREYGNKQATPWARMAVQRIKKYIEKLEIDNKSFNHLW